MGMENEGSNALYTAGDLLFLRPDIKMEPLVCGWYAWTHLLSPAQHAMNVAFRHLPLMHSFVNNPAVHVAASQDPALYGGPFVDLPERCVAEIRDLLRETQSRCASLISFARALRNLDEVLQSGALGYSMSSFYAQLDHELGGLVEFFYDLNNHPKIRIHEELLYDAGLGADTSEIMLSAIPDGRRPFFMNTPRLKSLDNLSFSMPFSDSRIDTLASMRTAPRSSTAVINALQVPKESIPLFLSLFTTTQPPRKAPDYCGDGVRVRYFGHACVLLQTDTTSILIDPLIACGAATDDGRFTFLDLPDFIDCVVISHNHQDHFTPESLIQLKHRVGRFIVPANNSGSLSDPSMQLVLNRLGVHAVDVLSAFRHVDVRDGRITSLPFPGEHADLDVYSRHGIHVELKGRRFMFLVDSDGWDPRLFARIRRKLSGGLNAIFLGMECHGAPLTWLYGPLLTSPISRRDDESRRLSGLDSERAWRVLEEISADNVFIYAMGQEPWLRFIMGLEYSPDSIQLVEVKKLLERCRANDIRAENLFLSREITF
jgi:L-ascorbate metabolism protein UlaG (beta-lactamase superfamily)